MSKKWCKIIELEKHDVVVHKDYKEGDSHPFVIRIMADFEIGLLTTTLSGSDEKKRDMLYDDFGVKMATGFIDQMNEMIFNRYRSRETI